MNTTLRLLILGIVLLSIPTVSQCATEGPNAFYRHVVVKEAPGKGEYGQCEAFARFVAKRMSERTVSYEVGYAWWNHKPPFGHGLHKVVVWLAQKRGGYDIWMVDNMTFKKPKRIGRVHLEANLTPERLHQYLSTKFDRDLDLVLEIYTYGLKPLN